MTTRTKGTKKSRLKTGLERNIYNRRYKGSIKASFNRTERAIRAAKKAGKSPKTDRKLAEMIDRLYGTDFLSNFTS